MCRIDKRFTTNGGPDVEGADTVFGGPGNDTIFVRDGEPDVVSCGSGFDVVVADPTDIVRSGCERVHVGEPRPHEDAAESIAS